MKLKLKLVGALCAIGVMQSASALTVVGNSITNLATEHLSNTTAVNLNNIGFNSSTQGVVAGNSFSIRITLNSGTFAAAPALGCGDLTQSDPNNNAGTINGVPTVRVPVLPPARIHLRPVRSIPTPPQPTHSSAWQTQAWLDWVAW